MIPSAQRNGYLSLFFNPWSLGWLLVLILSGVSW